MNSDKKIKRILRNGIIVIITLIVTYMLVNKISQNNEGVLYEVEKIVKSIVIALIGFTILKIIMSALINPYEEKKGIHIHNFVKDIVGFIILFISAIAIVTQVYDAPIAIMMAYLTGSVVAIGWVTQDFLKQSVAGLVIDFQNEFKVADWIKLSDGTVGKISKIKLTRTEILLTNESTLYINNSKLLNESAVKLNQSEFPSHQFLNVVLEYSVPIELAVKVLTEAVKSCPDTCKRFVNILVDGAEQNGVTYRIDFRELNQKNFPEIKHQIVSSVVSHLVSNNLKICQISWELPNGV